MNLFATFMRGLTALLLVVLAMSPAFGEEIEGRIAVPSEPEARVVVPGQPGGAVVKGCYAITQELYGPYKMSFCLKSNATYKVRGRDGLKCDGRLSWSVSGRDVSIKLRRADCNKGKDCPLIASNAAACRRSPQSSRSSSTRTTRCWAP